MTPLNHVLLAERVTPMKKSDAAKHTSPKIRQLSALDALYYPASMSATPMLVDRGRLKAANALVQGVEQISGVLGPALAGLLLAVFGLWINLGTNAILFFVAAAILATVRRPRGSLADGARAETEGSTREDTGALAELVEGARYAWNDPVIRTIMLILIGINLAMAGPIYVGGSMLAEDRLGGAGTFATLVALGGVGSLVGAVAAGSSERVPRRGFIELACTAALGVGVAGLAFAPNLLVAGTLAVLLGATASFLAVVNISWLQERSEPGLTGRVMSLAMFFAISLDRSPTCWRGCSSRSTWRRCSWRPEACFFPRPCWGPRAARCARRTRAPRP